MLIEKRQLSDQEQAAINSAGLNWSQLQGLTWVQTLQVLLAVTQLLESHPLPPETATAPHSGDEAEWAVSDLLDVISKLSTIAFQVSGS